MKSAFLSVWSLAALVACQSADRGQTLGSIERLEADLDRLVAPDAVIEVLSEGYDWSEGPVWIDAHAMLLFSDVPTNRIYQWREGEGTTPYLMPSGYTGTGPSNSREEGSNGLALSPDGKLVLCQHGDRRLAVMDAPLDNPKPGFVTLADRWDGKRFNSPNDLAVRSNGDYFFTDPPYGMPQDAAQEIPFQGVYKVSDGRVTLLVDTLSRPNGIALMPDEKTLIVANSDPKKPVWYAFDLSTGDTLVNGRTFHDASAAARDAPGLPDGLKIDRQGNVFATGPGGVWIFDRNARLLGKIKLPVASANCAFSADQKVLFITADQYLLRVRLRR